MFYDKKYFGPPLRSTNLKTKCLGGIVLVFFVAKYPSSFLVMQNHSDLSKSIEGKILRNLMKTLDSLQFLYCSCLVTQPPMKVLKRLKRCDFVSERVTE